MGDLKELCEAVGGLVQLVQVTQDERALPASSANQVKDLRVPLRAPYR